jgi:hypothetical protein
MSNTPAEELLEHPFAFTPMTRDEFIAANPFGSIKLQIATEEPRDMTLEEYDTFVENSKGIWA